MSDESGTEALGDLEEHVRPNVSRIEPYREEVALARKRRWPYDRIAAMLREQHGLTISDRAVSNFCRCRGIQKGVGETEAAAESQPEHKPPPARRSTPASPRNDVMASITPSFKKKKLFTPREGPIRTRSNGLLDEES